MFGPLRETITLLKKYGVEVKEEILAMLEDAPLRLFHSGPVVFGYILFRWESTINKVFKIKEKINPMQNREVDHIKRKVWDFHEEVVVFGERFKKEAPFGFANNIPLAYQTIAYFHEEISVIEGKALDLRKLENLFELENVPVC